MITKENFYNETYAEFISCETPDRKPDYVSYRKIRDWNYDFQDFENIPNAVDGFFGRNGDWCTIIETQEVSSEYWYNEEGVIRKSNHWGEVASCLWEIDDEYSNCGFSRWESFKQW